MFPLDSLTNIPRFETQKALFVIDFQNDFVSQNGKMFVENTRDILPKIPSLVAKFRETGEVFWIQTEFTATRPMIRPELGSFGLIVKEFLSPKQDDGPAVNGTNGTNGTNGIIGTNGINSSDSSTDEYHNAFVPVSPNIGRDDPEAFLANRLHADLPRCCLPNTEGCAMPELILSAIDHSQDAVLKKSDYSAFQSPSLILQIRMKLITKLYICGSLSNISVYATALDAVRHGLQITIVEDGVGYRDPQCHQEAMRQMADGMGAEGIDYQELMDDLSGNLGEVVTESTFQSSLGAAQVDGEGREHYTVRAKVKNWVDMVTTDAAALTAADVPRPSIEPTHAKRRSVSSRGGLSSAGADKQNDLTVPAAPPQKRNCDTIDAENDAEPEGATPDAKNSHVRTRIRRSPHHVTAAGNDLDPSMRPHSDSPTHHSNNATNQQAALPESKSLPEPGFIEPDPNVDRSVLELMPSFTDKAKAIGRTLRSSKESRQPAAKAIGPRDFIGERDSRIIYDFLPDNKQASEAFTRLRNDDDSREVKWQKMYHRSGEVPRLVTVQGQIEVDGSVPIYRHPADESPPLSSFSPTVQAIRQEVEKVVGHPLNHVLIQLYRSGEDNISEHSDKTLDIVRGSYIVNVSLGARRTMTLRTKKSAAVADLAQSRRAASAPPASPASSSDIKRPAQRVPLPHNSLFLLGQDTNQMWLHAIRADKRQLSEKTAEELAFNGERISLTFRHVGTYISPTGSTIWGQGATSKDKQGAQKILSGADADKEGERMIRAFGQENHQSREFKWDAQYGAGFDVVNFANESVEERNARIASK